MRKAFYLLTLALSGLLTACQDLATLDEIDRVTYDAEYAIPLINTSITLEDLLENFEENSTLIVDPDGQFRFIYRGDVLTKDREEIFASVDDALSAAGLIPINSNRVALPFSSPDGIQIDSLHLTAGTLIYGFANPHQDPITMEFSFPQVRQGGQPVAFAHSLPAWSGNGDLPFFTNAFAPYQLTGHNIIPENDSIFIEYQAFRNGMPDTLTNFFVIIQNLEFTADS